MFVPNQIQSVVLRYLVVESTAFNYIYIVKWRNSFSPSRQIGGGSPVLSAYIGTSVSVSKDDDYIMHIINGFDIYDNGDVSEEISI